MCSAYVPIVKPRFARTSFSALATIIRWGTFACLALVSTISVANVEDDIAAFNGGKFSAALKTLRPIADAGDPIAQCYVARLFNAATGGVRRDVALTKQYAERALRGLTTRADQGVASAQACLSVLRSSSNYLSEPNLEASLQLARLAAEQGNADGQRVLAGKYQRGIGIKRDYRQAYQWLEKASRGGSIHAKGALAVALRNGWGVKKDESAAALQFRALAEAGYAFAQTEYANMLREGTGVEQDYVRARQWYERAAAQFDTRAQNDLGYMYESGSGVPSNPVLASEWYQRSADQGNSTAQAHLGRLYLAGRGVVKDETKGLDFLRASADQNNARGQYYLGRALERGNGIPADTVQALAWYRKAAARSDEDAAAAIKRLTGKGPAETTSDEQKVEAIGEN